MRLRYLGPVPTSFIGLNLHVQPGEEFDVSDDAAPGLLVRSDVEKVQTPPRAPKARALPPKPDETTLTN